MQRLATGGLLPDLTVLLDLPPEIGLERVGTDRDRIEGQPLAFHRAVRDGFSALASRERGRYLVVDATASADEVADLVAAEVVRRLERVAGQRHVRRASAESVLA